MRIDLPWSVCRGFTVFPRNWQEYWDIPNYVLDMAPKCFIKNDVSLFRDWNERRRTTPPLSRWENDLDSVATDHNSYFSASEPGNGIVDLLMST
jgi:hypothetical protein